MKARDTQGRILRAVRARPGITLGELVQQLGLSWGSAQHYTIRLRRRGVLTVREVDRVKRLYASLPLAPAELPAPHEVPHLALWTPPLRLQKTREQIRRELPRGDDGNRLDPDGPVVEGVLRAIGRRPGITAEAVGFHTGFSQSVVLACVDILHRRRRIVRRGHPPRFWPRDPDADAPPVADFDTSLP